MKKTSIAFFFLAFMISSTLSEAQTATTFTAGANWSTGTWSNGLANTTSFDPTIASNINVNVTYAGIGNLTLNASRTLTIPVGQTLTIGASGLPKNFSAGGSTTINVNGTLIIWGNFTSGGSIQLNVKGTMTVKGNATFASGDNIDASPSGTINVNGTTTAPAGVQLQNGGTFKAKGGCVPAGSGFCNSGNLPITLVAFNSAALENGIQLSWSTASEINFDYFNLEKATNGMDFYPIARIPGHGTTVEKIDYRFVDPFPMIGNNYYRLTSVDFDNYRETFGVINQKYDGERRVTIFPNPSDGNSISVMLNYDLGEEIQVLGIFDALGSEIASFTVPARDMTFDFTNRLTPGTYYARLRCGVESHSIRFIVK